MTARPITHVSLLGCFDSIAVSTVAAAVEAAAPTWWMVLSCRLSMSLAST
jgi:hypothetical protein